MQEHRQPMNPTKPPKQNNNRKATQARTPRLRPVALAQLRRLAHQGFAFFQHRLRLFPTKASLGCYTGFAWLLHRLAHHAFARIIIRTASLAGKQPKTHALLG